MVRAIDKEIGYTKMKPYHKILAVDSCTEICSVALLSDQQYWAQVQDAPRDHSKNLLPMIDEVLDQAGIKLDDIDAFALTRGPGSFTGVRIGTSIVQGLAFGADKPVIEVSSLATMAQRQIHQHPEVKDIFCAIDARMGEVYFAHYTQKQGIARLVGEESVVAPEILLTKGVESNNLTAIVGTGFVTYPELKSMVQKQNLIESDIDYPVAEDMMTLAVDLFAQSQLKSAMDVQPIYLRNTVAWKKST